MHVSVCVCVCIRIHVQCARGMSGSFVFHERGRDGRPCRRLYWPYGLLVSFEREREELRIWLSAACVYFARCSDEYRYIYAQLRLCLFYIYIYGFMRKIAQNCSGSPRNYKPAVYPNIKIASDAYFFHASIYSNYVITAGFALRNAAAGQRG